MKTPSPLKQTDGRHARALANRDAAVRALLHLIRHTGEVPTASEVAARAGLSRRTVFRLFNDLESLHLAANEMQTAEVLSRFPPPLPQPEPLEATIARVVEHRAAVYEHIMPLRIVGERLRHQHDFIAQSIDQATQQLRAHLRALFAQHLPEEDTERFQALELLTSWYTWHTLRETQQCSRELALQVVTGGVRRLWPA